MFIVYSISNIAGTTNIKEEEFVTADRNYLQSQSEKLSVEQFLEYEKAEDIDYILPGNGNIDLRMKITDYYQISGEIIESYLTGSLVSVEAITEDDIIYGRMPQNEKEIVLDKVIYDKMSNGVYNTISHKGITSAEEMIDRKVSAGSIKEMTIVGIVDKKSPSIYANKNIFVNLLNSSDSGDTIWYGSGGYGTSISNNSDVNVEDYTLYLDDITITKGRMPDNDYEVIVNKANEYEMKLDKTIDKKINNVNLKVVGYYDSKTDLQTFLVNNNTVKYNEIAEKGGFMVYPKDKEAVLSRFTNEYNVNLEDKYEKDKEVYMQEQNDAIKGGVIFAGIILAISLVEIYLMERSSFLSRIREVGVLRAIGSKKFDIYKMFIGEILAITTFVSVPGVIFMSYILSTLANIPYVGDMFVINLKTISTSIILIYAFNIVVGLLPLFKVLRKTPAQILARHDIE